VTAAAQQPGPAQYPRPQAQGGELAVFGSFATRWGRTSCRWRWKRPSCVRASVRVVGRLDRIRRRRARGRPTWRRPARLTRKRIGGCCQPRSIALAPFADWCRGGGARQQLIQAAATGMAIVATPSALEGIEEIDQILVDGRRGAGGAFEPAGGP